MSKETGFDSGASLTIPTQAVDVKVNDYLLIDGFPCRCVDRIWSKPGKHGSAKYTYVGLDIFTGQKHTHLISSHKNIEVPIVTKSEYQLVDIEEEENNSYVSLMNDSHEIRNDIKLPDNEIGDKMKESFNNGKEISCTVLKSMNTEKIITPFSLKNETLFYISFNERIRL
jgi:translation initiation factor 5A